MALQTDRALALLLPFRTCYRLYMAVMGNMRFAPITVRERKGPRDDALEPADARATCLGEIYRGAGVFIGFLGVTALVLMIAPGALRLDPQWTLACGIARVLAIACAPAIAWSVISRAWKDNWVAARAHAERLRYRQLQEAAEAYQRDPDASPLPLVRQLLGLLSGPHGQVAYNRRKRREYTAVLRRTRMATVVAFVTSLAGAAAQLVWDEPTLLVLTALIPAFVGGLHGVNAFLHIGKHAEDHGRLASQLDAIREQVLVMQVKCAYEDLAGTAQRTWRLLTGANADWIETANRQVVTVF